MKNKDLISVIVPCYNIRNLVADSVATICKQTYQNLEIILVDDGSSDGTAEILEEIAKTDSRIQVIHKENGGVSSARLEGVRAAAGDWIGFVDGDDTIEPDMYEHLLENAYKYGADISHCGYQMVFPSRVDYYYNTGKLLQQDKVTGLKDLLTSEFIEPGLWNKLFRKTLFYSLLEDNVMDMSIANYEDFLMNYYLFREADLSVYEDFCPYHYVLREGSAATSKLNVHKLRDPLQVFKIIKQQTINQPQLQQIADKRIAAILVHLATLYVRGQGKLIAPFRIAARKELQGMAIRVIKGDYSVKQKLQVFVAVICPWGYSAVHTIYSVVRGTNKKYEVK